ncbi:30S ribosomal protein S19e [Candidatus Woesearchaeota archaeon]|nr:30S ribosomal protein S19e [Candidatus Woesearchaeota archaeon]
MSRMFVVNQTELIHKIAQKLKEKTLVKAPSWAMFAKTGTHRQRAPENADWWAVRAAAVLRKVAVKGPIGVSKLRTLYGGKKRRGHQPPEFRKGSGSVLRKVLQQLEKSQLIRQTKAGEFGVHKGRIVTPQGKSLLDLSANELVKSPVKASPKPSVPEVAPKKEVVVKVEAVPATIEQ